MLLTITTDLGNTVDVDIDPSEVNFNNSKEVKELVLAIQQAVQEAKEVDEEE